MILALPENLTLLSAFFRMLGESLTSDCSIEGVLKLLSDSQEYHELPVRHNEDSINRLMSRDWLLSASSFQLTASKWQKASVTMYMIWCLTVCGMFGSGRQMPRKHIQHEHSNIVRFVLDIRGLRTYTSIFAACTGSSQPLFRRVIHGTQRDTLQWKP